MKETFLFRKRRSFKVASPMASFANPIQSLVKVTTFYNSHILERGIPILCIILFLFQSNIVSAQNCGEQNWNDPTIKATLTGDYHIPGNGCVCGSLEVMVDNDTDSGAGTKNNNYSNIAAFTVNFPEATVLTGMEVVVNSSGSEPITGGVIRVEGSNDGVFYTPVSIDFTHGTNLNVGAAQYGTGTQAYTFPFANNTTAYSYYRIFAVSMSTRFGRKFNELYFDYEFFDAQLSNKSCDDNGTFENYTDDKLTFDLNPTPGVSGSYSVSIDGGFTITPTTGTYGQTTSFTVSSGSSGAGDLNLSFVDDNVPCMQTIVIENTENACIPGPCGGPDWNASAIKSTITGIWDIPGTPTNQTTGSLAILVDSDLGSGVSCKSNNFSNLPFIIAEFPEATVLTGMEVIIDASGNEAVTSGSFIVEGSNDGTSYTPVSGTFTYGTNLSATAPVYGPGTRGYTFPFASNTDSYTHYRIFANSMNTRFGRRFYELHFNYSVFNPELDNISFGDNGTPGLFTDDVIDFDLNPSPGSGTYSVDITGHTVTPSIGTYGQVTSFQVSSGSAGIGDLELLVIDQNVPCVQPVTLTNPDLTGTLESSHLACASPTDSPSGKLTLTGVDGVFTKADYSIGTSYTGTGYAGATAVSNVSSGFDLVTTLPNPTYTTYYTVRAYATETLYRDFVVSLDQKVCSVADLSLAVSPATDDANEGEQLTYVVTLTNAGPDPALNVDVKVDIPVGLQILSVSPSIGEYSAGTQLWSAELVPVGTHQLSVTYRMK